MVLQLCTNDILFILLSVMLVVGDFNIDFVMLVVGDFNTDFVMLVVGEFNTDLLKHTPPVTLLLRC